MAYEMVMPYHLHMPSYFLETFTEYPEIYKEANQSTIHFKRELVGFLYCRVTPHTPEMNFCHQKIIPVLTMLP